MTDALKWLTAKAPGFKHLSKKEQKAVTDFSLLWSLFENRCLNSNGSASAICDAVAAWDDARSLLPAMVDAELAYFQARYYLNGEFTYHFPDLNFRQNDRQAMVRGVLDGSDADPTHRVATALIIIYRYRNNLFHGPKWDYGLAGQYDNFSNANSLLMKTLDRHGQLTM